MDVRTPAHRTILIVDVASFGDRQRTNQNQVAVRAGLYRVLRRALRQAGIPWDECHKEDRGDGILILAPAGLPKVIFTEDLPGALITELREHNATSPEGERIRIKAALHAGEVMFDARGLISQAINLTFRHIDAPGVKEALAASRGVLALITSDWFYNEVVRHSPASAPASYRPVRVTVKETSTVGWIYLPDVPFPAAGRDDTATVHRQLPAPPRGFTGREHELAILSGALADDRDSVSIVTISGSAGMGKTSLALHWARQHSHRYPDGQLYIDLRGNSPAGALIAPAEAVRVFLDALMAIPAKVPVDEKAQSALYRSLLVGKRILIVLDNAGDTAQVVPLLPGSPTVDVIVTSVHRLTGLVVRDGARPLWIDALPEQEAEALLEARLGVGRLTREPDAVSELLRYCAGMPLALCIVAALAQVHPEFPLAQLAEQLRDETGRLTALDVGDPMASLSAVLSRSYRLLNPDHARIFALLGLSPGPDASAAAVAAMSGITSATAARTLMDLDRVSLVQQSARTRFRMHDLVRLYAIQQAEATLAASEQSLAQERLVGFYVRTASDANLLLSPTNQWIDAEEAAEDLERYPFANPAAALEWFEVEHACLLNIQKLAEDLGLHQAVWQLAWSLDIYHRRKGYLNYHLSAWQAALVSVLRLGEPGLESQTRRILGDAYSRAGMHDNALDELQQSLELTGRTGDLRSEADTRRTLAAVWARLGDDQRAVIEADHALHLFATLADRAGQADTLSALGRYQAQLGNYTEGRPNCLAALDLYRTLGDQAGEANVLDNLAYIARHTSQQSQALRFYQEALSLHRAAGNAYQQASTLLDLGEMHADLNRHDDARQAWSQARQLFQDQLRTEDAKYVEQRLTALSGDDQVDHEDLDVTVYTSADDGERLRDAVVELLDVTGFDVVRFSKPVRGSWFQRLSVRRRDSATMDKLSQLVR